jgi:RNA polymerase primary sigma factor
MPPTREAAASADSVRLYLNQIGQVALLEAEQEVDLAKRIEAGLYARELLRQANEVEAEFPTQRRRDLNLIVRDGNKAYHAFLEANLRLVVSLAKKYTGRGISFQDLIQEGNLGLIRAVEKFDYKKGYKFSTYATWWIRKWVRDALRDKARVVRIPGEKEDKIKNIRNRRPELREELGREPTAVDFAQDLDWPLAEVKELLALEPEALSLDLVLGEGDDLRLGDLIADSDAFDAGSFCEEATQGWLLESLLGVLDERRRTVLVMRYALNGGQSQTLEQIGRVLRVSHPTVRKLLDSALDELRLQRELVVA